MIAAALCFTLMNLCIKAAAQKFGLYSGELVFWRMSFAAAVLGITAKAQGRTFSTPHWKTHLNRSVIGSAAMLCLFYAVMHLPLATGVTLSYTSSIFLAVFSFLIFKERIAPYTQAVLVLGFAGVVLLLNPSFGSGQETAALVGLAGGAMSGWAYLQVRELSLLGRHGARRGLGGSNRLARPHRRHAALSLRRRPVGAGCATVDDPRVQSRQQIHRCLAILPDRRIFFVGRHRVAGR